MVETQDFRSYLWNVARTNRAITKIQGMSINSSNCSIASVMNSQNWQNAFNFVATIVWESSLLKNFRLQPAKMKI